LSLIDLHSHTTASDGSLAPEELVTLAKRQGVSVLAVTDHDTVAGLSRAITEGERLGVEIIPGIEISCLYGQTELHILGYFINPDDPQLKPALEKYWASREDRNPLIVQRLNELGCVLDYAEVKAAAGSATVGRPHIAQALLRKGYVKSVSEAFDRYLADDGPAYVPRRLPSPAEAIGLIRQTGGIPVLAHPVYTARIKEPFDDICETLKGCGLMGIESLYSGHNQQQTDRYCSISRNHGLLVTGGSDFHGDAKPNLLVGTGYGNLAVPGDLLEPMRALAGPRT
jgi:predicted metal-dependent phosphoesterase TrpH